MTLSHCWNLFRFTGGEQRDHLIHNLLRTSRILQPTLVLRRQFIAGKTMNGKAPQQRVQMQTKPSRLGNPEGEWNTYPGRLFASQVWRSRGFKGPPTCTSCFGSHYDLIYIFDPDLASLAGWISSRTTFRVRAESNSASIEQAEGSKVAMCEFRGRNVAQWVYGSLPRLKVGNLHPPLETALDDVGSRESCPWTRGLIFQYGQQVRHGALQQLLPCWACSKRRAEVGSVEYNDSFGWELSKTFFVETLADSMQRIRRKRQVAGPGREERSTRLVGPIVVLGGEVLGVLFKGDDGGRDLCEDRVSDKSLEFNPEVRERASRGPCTHCQML
ncbi:hypothetical protein C8R45DRAFT_948275 [Mycena sanguinolenta]|nr:hypothetical protein C8R45DRAFT_948275 [Mycena sanguinolenta]